MGHKKYKQIAGRNHEYFSEDPFLTGMLAKSYIFGVQESGLVAACIKHFCLNNQESNRMVVNVVADERTMRELYLPAFEISICQDGDKKQHIPKLVMAAYNKVNGLYCCENKYLLQSILRNEWKFRGVVISDWGAVSDRVESIKAGMDLEMPGTRKMGVFDKEVLEYVKEGGQSKENIEEVDPNSSLNGAQVTAILEIINKITTGEITKNTAIEVIQTSFPVDLERAKQIISDVEYSSNKENIEEL